MLYNVKLNLFVQLFVKLDIKISNRIVHFFNPTQVIEHADLGAKFHQNFGKF